MSELAYIPHEEPAEFNERNQPDTTASYFDDRDYQASYTHIDSVQQYLQSIGRIPLLTAEQEVDLSKRIEAGVLAGKLLSLRHTEAAEQSETDTELYGLLEKYVLVEDKALALIHADGEEARKAFIEANLRLVINIARRYRAVNMPLLDLIQEGNNGLMQAVNKFDYAQGFKFSTYATWWIKKAITRSIADTSRTIRMPVWAHHIAIRISREKQQFYDEHERFPTSAELAQIIELDEEKVKLIERSDRHTDSLNRPLNEDGVEMANLLISDGDAEAPFEHAAHSLLKDDLDALFNGHLLSREKFILERRYGFYDGKPWTHAEIAADLHLTRQRVAQIEYQARKRLSAIPELREKLIDYL